MRPGLTFHVVRYAPYGRYAAMAWYGGSDDGAPMRAAYYLGAFGPLTHQVQLVPDEE